MYIELKQDGGMGLVGFDASRIECVQDTLAVGEECCTVTLRSGAHFYLTGSYKEVVARIHKKNEEAKQRAQS